MVSKNNLQHKLRAEAKRWPHYGLRKLSVGVASVLLSTSFYLGMTSVAHADTVAPVGTDGAPQQATTGGNAVTQTTTQTEPTKEATPAPTAVSATTPTPASPTPAPIPAGANPDVQPGQPEKAQAKLTVTPGLKATKDGNYEATTTLANPDHASLANTWFGVNVPGKSDGRSQFDTHLTGPAQVTSGQTDAKDQVGVFYGTKAINFADWPNDVDYAALDDLNLVNGKTLGANTDWSQYKSLMVLPGAKDDNGTGTPGTMQADPEAYLATKPDMANLMVKMNLTDPQAKEHAGQAIYSSAGVMSHQVTAGNLNDPLDGPLSADIVIGDVVPVTTDRAVKVVAPTVLMAVPPTKPVAQPATPTANLVQLPSSTNNDTIINAVKSYGVTPSTNKIINLTDTGVVGDGHTDVTQGVQTALNQIKTAGGGILNVPSGNYMINATDAHDEASSIVPWQSNRGLLVPSNTTILFEPGAKFSVIPNASWSYALFNLNSVHDVNILGGELVGDREKHDAKYTQNWRNRVGYDGETGWGIMTANAKNVNIIGNNIHDFWGDGIDLYGNNTNAQHPEFTTGDNENIVIKNNRISNNRRQGISIENANGVVIDHNLIESTNGTAPSAGIDVEPSDWADARMRHANNVTITNNYFRDNNNAGVFTYGLSSHAEGFTDGPSDINNLVVKGNTFDHNNTNATPIEDTSGWNWQQNMNGQLTILGVNGATVENNRLVNPNPKGTTSADTHMREGNVPANTFPDAGMFVGFSQNVTVKNNYLANQDIFVTGNQSPNYRYPSISGEVSGNYAKDTIVNGTLKSETTGKLKPGVNLIALPAQDPANVTAASFGINQDQVGPAVLVAVPQTASGTMERRITVTPPAGLGTTQTTTQHSRTFTWTIGKNGATSIPDGLDIWTGGNHTVAEIDSKKFDSYFPPFTPPTYPGYQVQSQVETSAVDGTPFPNYEIKYTYKKVAEPAPVPTATAVANAVTKAATVTVHWQYATVDELKEANDYNNGYTTTPPADLIGKPAAIDTVLHLTGTQQADGTWQMGPLTITGTPMSLTAPTVTPNLQDGDEGPLYNATITQVTGTANVLRTAGPTFKPGDTPLLAKVNYDLRFPQEPGKLAAMATNQDITMLVARRYNKVRVQYVDAAGQALGDNANDQIVYANNQATPLTLDALPTGYHVAAGLANLTATAAQDADDITHVSLTTSGGDAVKVKWDDANTRYVVTVPVVKNAVPATATITYHDDTTNTDLKTDTANGNVGEAISFATTPTAQIKTYTDAGYVLVSDSFTSQNYVEGVNAFTVHLKHGVKELAPETKTVTRTINVTNPVTKVTTPTVQTAKFHRTATKDLATNKVTYGQWNNDQRWAAFDVPTVAGYTATETTALEQAVQATDANVTVNVTYTADSETVKVLFEDAQGKVIQTTPVTGKMDRTVDLTETTIPTNWVLTGDDPRTTDYKLGTNNPDVIVKIQHGTQDVSTTDANVTKTVTRTINVTNPVTKVTTPTVQTATFHRTATKDLVTGAVTYGKWNNDQKWDAFKVPTVAGFTPSVATIPAVAPTDVQGDQTVKVTYTANPASVRVVFVDAKGQPVGAPQTVTGVVNGTVDLTKVALPTGWVVSGTDLRNAQYTLGVGNADIKQSVQHGTKALPDDAKDVTRTIEVTKPDGKAATVTQTARFTRTSTEDLVDHTVTHGDWNADQKWPAYEGPAIANVAAPQVPEQVVTPATPNVTVKVHYQDLIGTTTVSYVDGMTGKVVATETVTGKLGDQMPLTKVADLTKAGYQVLTPAVTINAQTSTQKVTLAHQVLPANQTVTVTRTIQFVGPDGKALAKPVVQTVAFNQTGTKDGVTGATTWPDAQPQEFASVKVPSVPGYTTSLVTVPAMEVTPLTAAPTVMVKYTKDQPVDTTEYATAEDRGLLAQLRDAVSTKPELNGLLHNELQPVLDQKRPTKAAVQTAINDAIKALEMLQQPTTSTGRHGDTGVAPNVTTRESTGTNITHPVTSQPDVMPTEKPSQVTGVEQALDKATTKQTEPGTKKVADKTTTKETGTVTKVTTMAQPSRKALRMEKAHQAALPQTGDEIAKGALALGLVGLTADLSLLGIQKKREG